MKLAAKTIRAQYSKIDCYCEEAEGRRSVTGQSMGVAAGFSLRRSSQPKGFGYRFLPFTDALRRSLSVRQAGNLKKKIASLPSASLRVARNDGEVLKQVVCAFSNKIQGNMSLSYGDTSRSLGNRKSFLSALAIDYQDLVCAKQIHGSHVKYVNQADIGSGALAYASAIADTDGLITDTRNLPLGIFTADCLSIFLYDPKRPAVGLLHAGWRSSKEKIVSCALELMHSKFKTNPAELFAGFGPAIRDCCYEVSGGFKDNFSTGLTERQGRLYLDLAQVNKRELIDAGLKQENIFDPGFCTACDNEDLFSFRREGKNCGRMLSVISLR